MAKAHVERYHGEPAIMIDGVPYPPMTITTRSKDSDYLRRLGEAGLRIFYIEASTRWNRPGDGTAPDGITAAIEDMTRLFEAVPEAYVMLRLNVSPPADWVNAHPEEQVMFNDGSHRPVICTTVARGKVIDGMYSMASRAWHRDADRAVRDFFAEIEKHPHFNRVIGFFLCAGGTDEWYYPGEGVTGPDGLYGDFSEPFRAAYAEILREKYGTVEELRRVWRNPDADFDHPTIPGPEDRVHINEADQMIAKGLEKWESVGYTVGESINPDAKAPSNFGVFLNANGYLHTADFYDAWHEVTARAIVHFGHTLKDLHPELLVGAFYGSYGCTDYYDLSTATHTLTILDSGVVDFLAAPGVYNNREPGGVVAQREMQDSFRLRNQIYICEDDSRTHRSLPTIQRETMGLYTPQDSVNTLKRDFARDICEDINGWWFDMGGDWYDDPAILALFARQQEIAKEAYSLDRTKKNEIALIYDTESVHCVSEPANRLVLDLWRTSDLHRIGAPVDYYFHDDLARPDMPDYKLYIMVNQYCLSDAERKAVYAKARRNHAVVLWMYAPGFIDRESEPVMALENIERTVGMKLGLIDHTAFPYFKVTDSAHPALAHADPYRRYGFIDRDVHSNIWVTPTVLPPTYMNPGFFIDDPDVTVLGRYCLDGKAAYAMREMDGFTSVYCCTQVVRGELLASLASWAGCHLYTGTEDVLYANENYVALHASYTGSHRVSFKQPCTPVEVYEGRAYGENVSEIEVDMHIGETKMWRVKPL
ncbi:MAG: hypothetical protein E7463_13900 [Ruminococcaceae bacterium]|nr:hypothetical protein [Oscillospiraceae bacterium]